MSKQNRIKYPKYIWINTCLPLDDGPLIYRFYETRKVARKIKKYTSELFYKIIGPFKYALVAQQDERHPSKVKDAGSKPAERTLLYTQGLLKRNVL